MALPRKLRKELIDQPAHFLWAAATFIAPWLAWLLPVPLWASILLTVAAVASFLGLIVREVRQKAHKPGGILHHWPWLDFCFYTLGAIAATVAGAVLKVMRRKKRV